MQKFFTKKLLILPAILSIFVFNSALAYSLVDFGQGGGGAHTYFTPTETDTVSTIRFEQTGGNFHDANNADDVQIRVNGGVIASLPFDKVNWTTGVNLDFVLGSPYTFTSGVEYEITFGASNWSADAVGYYVRGNLIIGTAPAGGGEEGDATPMFTIPTSTAPNIMKKATEAFSATLIIFALVVGLPVAFWVINQFIDIFPKPKSHKKRRN